MPDQTSGPSHQVSGYIRMFVSYMSDHFRIMYVRAYCSIYVKIVLIIKDDGFADENVGWTCIITKTVFRVSDHIRVNMAVHCTL